MSSINRLFNISKEIGSLCGKMMSLQTRSFINKPVLFNQTTVPPLLHLSSKLSMENLETVVRERNRAYHWLETGKDGERPQKSVYNQLGLKFLYREFEHAIPKMYNKKWRETHVFHWRGHAVAKFRKLYKEKMYNEKRKAKNRDRNEVRHILRRFPHVSKDLLARKYPSVDIAKIVRNDEGRGHFDIK